MSSPYRIPGRQEPQHPPEHDGDAVGLVVVMLLLALIYGARAAAGPTSPSVIARFVHSFTFP